MAFKIKIYGKNMEFANAVEAAAFIKAMNTQQSSSPLPSKEDAIKQNKPVSYAVKYIRKEWEYDIIDDCFVCLTEYKGKQEIVSVPPRVGKLPVRRIDRLTFSPSRAFSTQEQINTYVNIKQVTIPEGIYVIGDSAFKHCQKLESIMFPSTLCDLGAECFCDCVSLQNIIIPDEIEKIPSFCFYACRSLKRIYIPDSVRHIDSYAFAGCTSLEKVFIPKSIKIMDFSIFERCPNITIYTEPFSYAKAFADNYHLPVVVLDKSGVDEKIFRLVWDEV